MSRLACLSGPDGRATAPAAGRPAAGAATAGGRSCAVAEERAEQVHGQREDDGGVLVGAELARRSHGTIDQTCFRQADGSLAASGRRAAEICARPRRHSAYSTGGADLFRVVDVRPVAFSAAFSASPVPAVLASAALTALPRPLGAGQRAFREALEAHAQMVPAGAVAKTAGHPRRAAPAAVPVPTRAAPRRAGRPPTCRAAPAAAANGRRRAGCPSRRACGRPARAAGTPAG